MPIPSDIRATIDLLRLHSPDAVRLGELVSLAVRIEPELLRAARLKLTPFDAAAEADLWFSSLVETRTVDWIALAPLAAEELRLTLAADQSRLNSAHALLLEAHSYAPATITLEEEIVWLALSAPADAQPAIESRLRLVLGKLLQDSSAHRGLAHWFAGAARRLPEVAQGTEAYALLCFVTSGLLDGRRINASDFAPPQLDALAGLWPASIPKLSLWATLADNGLILRPNRVPGFVLLEVPRTDPLLLELRQANEPRQIIALERGETKTVRINARAVELHTAAGDAYRLRHRPQERVSESAGGLILGFGGTGAHILTALKELTMHKHGRVAAAPRFLLFDTIADWRPGKTVAILKGEIEERLAEGDEEKHSLDPASEYFYLGDHDPDLKTHVYDFLSPAGNPDRYPHFKNWLHAPWIGQNVRERHLNIVDGVQQQRQIGRYAMFKNADRILAFLRRDIQRLAHQVKGSTVNIWLIGSAAGGTGAGCIVDAAYLTRLAAGDNIRITITGVIVLPNVYAELPGISQGRAYSLLRELDRVQGQGIQEEDRYTYSDKLISSQVAYDAQRLHVAQVRTRLFDNLFYLGRECHHDEQRQDFFASVANAIDPYLDENSGPVLLQERVNETVPILSVGASRLYVPEETLAYIFAWEEVESYLRKLAAPNEDRNGMLDVYSGSPADRQESANVRVGSLLALFGDLLERANQRDENNRRYVQNTVTPETIVAEWYQFGGGAIAGIQLSSSEKTAVQLTYVNPYISLTETDETKVTTADRTIKTYKENEKAKGLKESQDQSKVRFAAQLEEITRKYTHAAGGEHTFVKGLKQVSDIVATQLRRRVDRTIIDELTQADTFVVDPDNPRQGTVLTRLRAECQYAIIALRKIDELVARFLAALNEEAAFREQQPVRALNQLNLSKSPGIFGVIRTWVEILQQSARDECYEYIRWYQKRELIKNMQQLVRTVIERFEEWQAVFDGALNGLVLQQPESSWYIVRERFLRRLAGRLFRLGQNQSARISWEPQPFDKRHPDVTMQGYREELKKCVYVTPNTTLADEVLAATRWEALINKDGLPDLVLAIELRTRRAYASQNFSEIHRDLYEYFRERIKRYLENKDIFDYLLYAQNRGAGPEQIAKLLNDAAQVLINADATEECRLIFKDPRVPEKQNLATAIKNALRGNPMLIVNDSETTHSDKNSFTLLKIKRSNAKQNTDIQDCRNDYFALRDAGLNNDEKHDMELRRAQVFHPFPQELEAWYIERCYSQEMTSGDMPDLPPRIVRLLEDPEMMQIFVHAIATGAVERIENKGWYWHAPDGDIVLSEDEGANVVKAAVIFVLEKGEGRGGGIISREAARQSVLETARKRGRARDEMLIEFVKENLDSFLEANSPADLRLALKIVFRFYCDPDRRTGLQFRVNLP
jgi:hypothetical protein